MRLKSFLIISAVLVVVYFTYQYFVAGKENEVAGGAPQGGFPVEVMKVRSGEQKAVLSTVGTLKPDESVILRPEMAGRVEKIHAAEGAVVKKGALLISLDDRMIVAGLKQAEAAANLARVSYNRAKLLKEKGVGTVSNFDTMQAALKVAEAQVDLARAQLDKMRIIAPFDGEMGLRNISEGGYVNIGQDIAGFSSNNPMKVDFTLPENVTATVAVGQNIEVVVDAIPGRSFTGKIYAIDSQIDAVSRNIHLRARMANDDHVLKGGLFARVRIITAAKANALFVPEAAIVPRGNDSFVMRVAADKKVATVPVKIGERRNGEVEILEGLSADDLVVTAGHLKIRDGQEVSF